MARGNCPEGGGDCSVSLVRGARGLLVAPAFAQGQEAGQGWARVKAGGAAAAVGAQQLDPGLDAALAALRAAEAAKAQG